MFVTPQLIYDLKQQQEHLRNQIRLVPLPNSIKYLAACDCSIINDTTLFAVFILFTYPDLTQHEVQTSIFPMTLPYIPGLLSFREIPGLIDAFNKLTTKPDLIMVDGNGILHPRRLGIATHLGLTLNIPTIGIAKKKLTGSFDPLTNTPFTHTPVIHQNETIAYALRAKPNTTPVFISPGHLCTLQDALKFTLTVYKKYKLPEPTRIADKLSKQLKPSPLL